MWKHLIRFSPLFLHLLFRSSQGCSFGCDLSVERICYDNIWESIDEQCNGLIGCVAMNKPCAGECLPRYPVLSKDGQRCKACTEDGKTCPHCKNGEMWCRKENTCKPRTATCGGKCPSLLYPVPDLRQKNCYPCAESSRWCKEERKCHDVESEPCNGKCTSQGFNYCPNSKTCQISCRERPTDERQRESGKPVKSKDKNELCNSKIDAMVQTLDGSSYVFKADNYWKLAKNGIASGYPRKISQDWPGLPGNVNAAVSWKLNRNTFTYFFKGNKYWKFTDQTPSPGYPRNIKEWGRLPANLDGGLEFLGSDFLYFFKGSQYWRYSKNLLSVSAGYPKQISTGWKNVPNNIDSAFQSLNSKIYFFKSGQFIDFQQEYAGDAGKWWFGCPGKKAKKKYA